MNIMMKCGHAANSMSDGKPSCVICDGPDSLIVVDAPNLTNREAQCAYCKKATPSSVTLAFFEARPNKPYDSFYCGCRGWD